MKYLNTDDLSIVEKRILLEREKDILKELQEDVEYMKRLSKSYNLAIAELKKLDNFIEYEGLELLNTKYIDTWEYKEYISKFNSFLREIQPKGKKDHTDTRNNFKKIQDVYITKLLHKYPFTFLD